MKNIPSRLIVYTKDVMNITGRSKNPSRNILAAIRKKYNKPPKALVTIEEFCEFTGLKEDKVIPFLT